MRFSAHWFRYGMRVLFTSSLLGACVMASAAGGDGDDEATVLALFGAIQLEMETGLTGGDKSCVQKIEPYPFPQDVLSEQYLWYVRSLPSGFKASPVVLTEKEKLFFNLIESKVRKSKYGSELFEASSHLGFQFAGFTGSTSKANTNPQSRLIRIREGLDSDTATLSLTYEFSNLINSGRYRAILEDAQLCQLNETTYAKLIMKLEAEAILRRSIVARELGLDHLVENKNYHRIALAGGVPTEDKIGMIVDEMRERGKVGQNKIPVTEYYRSQFKQYYRHCL
jgi:hypothetical protein